MDTNTENEANELKNEVRSMFIDSAVVVFAFILTAASIIPIIGPAIASYAFGINKYRNESYGLFKKHILVAILISGALLLFISWLVSYVTLEFYHPKTFWQIIIIAISLSLIISLLSFFLGDYQARKKK